MAFDIDMIKGVYASMGERVDKARELVGKPLTLSEKILYSHLWDGTPTKKFTRGKGPDGPLTQLIAYNSWTPRSIGALLARGGATVLLPAKKAWWLDIHLWQMIDICIALHCIAMAATNGVGVTASRA